MATTEMELLAPRVPSSGTAMDWIGGQWLDSTEHGPTLLEVTDSRLPIVQQEVFGPVHLVGPVSRRSLLR